jgi:hypothetical protein
MNVRQDLLAYFALHKVPHNMTISKSYTIITYCSSEHIPCFIKQITIHESLVDDLQTVTSSMIYKRGESGDICHSALKVHLNLSLLTWEVHTALLPVHCPDNVTRVVLDLRFSQR